MIDSRQSTHSVDNTMGASLIGVICAAMLYGVSCVQTWYYFNRYSKDVWYIKALVGGVWFFDSVHQMLISHTVYYYVISNYNNPAILTNMVWSILLEVLFNGFIGFLVQMFLTLRVWRCTDATSPSILNEPRLRDYSEQSKHPVDSRCGRIGSGGIWLFRCFYSSIHATANLG